MADNIIGLAMGLDVADLKAGLNEVKKELKTAKQEFNLATAGMDKWTASSDGLTAKLKQLDKQLASQKKVVAGYQAEIERVSQLEGDHSEELERLRAKLVDAQIAVTKTEKSIEKYNSQLSDMVAEQSKAESTLGQLTDTIKEQEARLAELGDEYRNAVLQYGKNSKQARTLKGEIQQLSGELGSNREQIQKVDKELELLDKSFDETGDSADRFSGIVGGLNNIGKGAIKGLAALGAAATAAIGGFLASGEATREFRTNMGKIEAGFTTSGLSAEQASKTYEQLWSIVADDGKATEATAMLGQLAKSQEELDAWTNILTGTYATFGDSLPIENLAEASLETSKTGVITGGLADALNWAGVSEDKFQESLDKCTTEQERQALITETLNDLYSDASKKYQEVNKDVIESNKSQAELASTMAMMGEKAEPIMTALRDGFNEILESVIGLLENADFDAIEQAIDNAFSYFIDTIVPAIKDGFQWIIDNKDYLIAGIIGIGTALLTLNVVTMIQGVVSAFKAWTAATQGMTIAQKALNLVLSLNPVGLVVTAVASLTAAFIYLWNTSDKFRNFWIGMWEKVKAVTLTVVNAIKTYFTTMWKVTNSIWGGAAKFFVNIVKGIQNAFSSIPGRIKTFFSNAYKNATTAFSKNQSFFSGVVKNIINAFIDLPGDMLSIGSDLVRGLWNGISDMAGWINGKIKGFGEGVLNGIKDFFGIRSPSRVMAEMGGYLAEGLGLGLERGVDEVTAPLDTVRSEIKNKIDDIKKEIERSDIKKTMEGLGIKLDNPFEGWSGAKLTAEIKKVESEYVKLEAPLKRNLELMREQGETEALVKEQAELVAQRMALQNDLIELATAKLERHKQVGETDTTWATGKLEKYQSELDATINVAGGLESRLDEIAQNEEENFDGRKVWQKWVDNAHEALHGSEDDMKKWADGTGKYLTKMHDSAKKMVDKASEFASGILNVYNAHIQGKMDAIDQELEIVDEQYEHDTELAQTKYDEEMAQIQALYEQEAISKEEMDARKLLSQQNLDTALAELDAQKKEKEDALQAEKNRLAEKQFNAEKANNIAMALVNGALAIVKGFADLGPIGGAVNAGIQAGVTAFQVATIAQQKYVPMLAKGGIVDGATHAIIGEAGKEAVLPLENNTGWMDDLAMKLASIMSMNLSAQLSPSVVYSGDVTNNYNYNYNQTINSPTALTRREIYRDTKNLLALKGV